MYLKLIFLTVQFIKNILMLLFTLIIFFAALVNAEEIELRSSLDTFYSNQSTIKGLHSLTALWKMKDNYYVGQSIYSAALGDAGGAFFWGYEVGKRYPITSNNFLNLSTFLGGGGGASQVPGDGLMTRTYAGVSSFLTPTLSMETGISYIYIKGSTIQTAALSLGFSYLSDGLAPEFENNNQKLFDILAIKPTFRTFNIPGSVVSRSQSQQGNVSLVGIEIAFDSNGNRENFISGDGAFMGDGEGYMNIMLGTRGIWEKQNFQMFGDVSLGFGGGGDIDTGPGILGAIGIGGRIPLSKRIDLELGIQSLAAFNGSFNAISPYIRTSYVFKRPNLLKRSQKFQYSTGFSYQLANLEFRKVGDQSKANPVLNFTSLDVFLNDNFYLIGEAQTVMLGDAGGYALGLLGLGYRHSLSNSWNLSPEIFIGAAGGGGVETKGGLLAGGQLELDYKFSERIWLSAGFGYLASIKGKGMAPTTINLGLKIPFSM
jgi:hypothetical protein